MHACDSPEIRSTSSRQIQPISYLHLDPFGSAIAPHAPRCITAYRMRMRIIKVDLEHEAVPVPAGTPVKLGVLRGLQSLQIVRHFNLSWFSVPLGWGGTALAINGFPEATGDFKHGLNIAATVIWFWALVYCAVFTLLLLARICMYPVEFWAMMKRPNHFLFFGLVPMALGVLGMGFVTLGSNIMEDGKAYDIAHVIFWIDVSLVIVSMTLPPFMMMAYGNHHFQLHAYTPFLLFPFLSAVVCAALAGTIGPFMRSQNAQLNINVAGYLLVGAGLFCSSCIIPTYMVQVLIHGFPPNAVGNSIWIVLGPIRLGANSLMMLGRNTGSLQCMGALCIGCELIPGSCICQAVGFGTTGAIPLNPLNSFGLIAPGFTLLLGAMMWGFGVWWASMSLTATMFHARKTHIIVNWFRNKSCRWAARHCAKKKQDEGHMPPTISRGNRGSEDDNNKLSPGVTRGGDEENLVMFTKESPDFEKLSLDPSKHMPFSLGWWGVVFPLVALVTSTYQLHESTQWNFFLWIGRIFCCSLVATSSYVHYKTLYQALFQAEFWHKFYAA
eukprot:gene10577-12236_t